MDIGALVAIVLPVFGFIALGYLTVATRLLGEEVADSLGAFVFSVAMPILLMRGVSTLALPDINPFPYYLSYFGGAAINIAIGVVLIRRVFARDARVGVTAGMSAAYSNIVMLGLPIVSKAFGEEGLTYTLMLIAVHLPIMMLTSAIMIEFAEVSEGRNASVMRAASRAGLNLVRNPMVIGIAAGTVLRFSGLEITGVPATVVDGVAGTAIPLALIALGMSLRKFGIRGNIEQGASIGVVKLFVMPAVVYVLAHYVFGLPDLAVATAVIAAACPTGANAYLIATRFQTGLKLSANAITLTTASSAVTMWLWLAVLGVW